MGGRCTSLHTNHTDVYLIKTPKTLTNLILDSNFLLWQRACLRVTPWFFFSLSSVIIPFPPCERKDQNNPAEICGSPGAEPLCWSKWKTRAAVAEWDTARSRVSRPPGARCIDTDTGHYMIRLYGDQLGSVMRDTEHVQFTEETVSWNLIWGWMTGCRWNNSTCSSACGEQRMERLRSFLREINESRKIFSPVQTVFTTKYPTIQLRSPFLHSVSQIWQQYPHQDSRHPQMPFLPASWIYWTYQHFHCAKVLACSLWFALNSKFSHWLQSKEDSFHLWCWYGFDLVICTWISNKFKLGRKAARPLCRTEQLFKTTIKSDSV